MADIKEIAREAGVSISTVSRVMNDSKAVSPELTHRVKKAVETHGYTSNALASGLKNSKTKKIAFVVTSISRIFFTAVLEGINGEAKKEGYSVLIAETNDSLERERELLEDFASQWVDGIILASSAYGEDKKTKEYIHFVEKLSKKKERIPVVTLEYAFPDSSIDAIVLDHEEASYRAVKHMIQELGGKKIIHISLPKGHLIGEKRIHGFTRAMEEAGFKVGPESIAEGDYSSQSGYRVVKELIKKKVSFDGLFCANDQMAVGALKALAEEKVRVPEEVKVIGNDDIFVASVITPSLSSIVIPKQQLGATAAKHLFSLMQGTGEKDKKIREMIQLETGYAERESTVKHAEVSLENLDW